MGIVAGFTALILGERLGANETARAHQAYVLRGLLGITFLFAVIAMVAFVGATLKPAIAQASLPPVDQVVTQLSSNRAVRLRVILAATNEFTFFAIPAALLYLYSLSADIIERLRRIKE